MPPRLAALILCLGASTCYLAEAAARHGVRVAIRTSPLPPTWTRSTEAIEEAPDAPDDISSPGGMDADRIDGQATRAACLRELRRRSIPFRRAEPRDGVWLPVVITGPLHGVTFKPLYHRRPTLVDCQFALGLERGAAVLARFGVKKALYTSTYRPPPRRRWRSPGHHPQGMAIDINELVLDDGTHLSILKDWEKQYGGPGACVGRPKTRKGALLRRMTCALEKAHVFRRILSPDSDRPHRNHWHISGARAGEVFTRERWCGRTLNQPLPGDRGFGRWYRWYSCWKLRNPRVRYRCYRRRARRRPRPPVRYAHPDREPRAAIWLKTQVKPDPQPPTGSRAEDLPEEPTPRDGERPRGCQSGSGGCPGDRRVRPPGAARRSPPGSARRSPPGPAPRSSSR